jgi:hypothetical protein
MDGRTTSAVAILFAALSGIACGSTPALVTGDRQTPKPMTPDGGDAQTPAVMTPDAAGDAMTVTTTAQEQCPPDVSLPIPTRTCPATRESGAGKIMGKFPTDGSAVVVLIGVSGAAPVCDVGSCREGNCPQQMAIWDYWAAENLASQKCVRDLVDSVGGSSSPEQLGFVDFFVATLTWAQIQTVATHPHVESISPSEGGGTPPP